MSAAAQAPAAIPDGRPFSWRFTAPLFMGSALNPINSSLIATALVPIAHALHVSVGRTSVLVTALYLASAIAQPTAGKLSEEFGPRRVFLTGILLVLAGGVLGSVGGSIPELLAARVLIGVGTSAGYPSAMVLIRRRAAGAGLTEPPGSVLGALSIAGQATVALGLPLGGVLVGAAGWRWVFLVNIPVTLAALAMTLRWVPRDEPAAAGGARRGAREIASRIDLPGIALFGGAMVALLVFLMDLPGVDAPALAAAVVCGAALAWWELRAATPFLDLRLLASNLALSRTYLRNGLTLLGVYAVMYGVTQWLEAGHGYSAEQAGLLILPMSAVGVLVSAPVSRRNLVRGPLVASAVSALAASIGLLFLDDGSPAVAVVAVTLVFGITVGTTAVGNQTALYRQAPAAQVGTASGLFRSFGYIGSIASSTITGVVFKHRVDDGGLHTIALILVGTTALVLLMTLADRALRSRPAPAASGTAAVPGPRTTPEPNTTVPSKENHPS